jgi:hypothetical protein
MGVEIESGSSKKVLSEYETVSMRLAMCLTVWIWCLRPVPQFVIP